MIWPVPSVVFDKSLILIILEQSIPLYTIHLSFDFLIQCALKRSIPCSLNQFTSIRVKSFKLTNQNVLVLGSSTETQTESRTNISAIFLCH